MLNMAEAFEFIISIWRFFFIFVEKFPLNESEGDVPREMRKL